MAKAGHIDVDVRLRFHAVDDEMVERAARTLYRIDADAWGDRTDWEQLSTTEQAEYLSVAREVLLAAALRTEPKP